MNWTISFISYEDFKDHVRKTIESYGDKLKPIDVKQFNSNIIDPIKMIFDKAVYNKDWEQLINSEIFRQRDKSNTNEIGYFHQKIFSYMDNCTVPPNGQEGGWDVIYKPENGISIDENNKVGTVYVEMKNKHNTMNSSASAKTYLKMQAQLLSDDDCACFLVEAIAKRSQSIIWKTTVDKMKVSHRKIRRVSLDKFYELVTGEEDAFFQICQVLPEIVAEVINEKGGSLTVPTDTVYEELKKEADDFEDLSGDQAMIMAMYLLGFSSYNGFRELAAEK